MKKIAEIVLSNTTRKFDRPYSYEIPPDMSDSVKKGVRVFVPFGKGNKLREGYVIGYAGDSEKELKAIHAVIDNQPLLDESMLLLANWMKNRYICTYSDVMRCMLPPGIGMEAERIVYLTSRGSGCKGNLGKILSILEKAGGECGYNELKVLTGIENISSYIKELQDNGAVKLYETFEPRVKAKTVRAARLVLPEEEAVDEIESGRIKKIQQIRVLEILLENEFVAVSDLTRFADVSVSILNTMRKNGYIEYVEIEVKRDPLKYKSVERTDPPEFTGQQAAALEKLSALLAKESYSEALLHGITGSGKTEVYLSLIKKVLANGRQAIMLVPEISLTPQAVERLKSRFGDEVAVLHSRLSIGERYDQWRAIRDGRKKVVVGARSAVFAPLSNLGIIIIDEEHETSYKSETTPRYNALEVARKRCSFDNALLIYGSATPSVETYYRAVNGEMDLVELTERANNAELPAVRLVDMRKELDNGNRTMFSSDLVAGITENMESGRQTILFLNRRGYASFIMCRSCGYTLKCVNCSMTMTYHSTGDRLICHYCGYTEKQPGLCPKCGSSHIRQFGTGTQKVEEELNKLYPGSTVIRMDIDTTGGKNSHEKILNAFREQNINILVGTQMIAKGHDFPNVTLVGVLAADSLLNIDDFRASERTFQLLTQVAGRAGRGETRGKVIFQTYNTEDFSIQASCTHDYKAFYKQEISLRERLEYPPFTYIGMVLVSGTDDRYTYQKIKEVKSSLEVLLAVGEDNAKVLGPARAPIPKIRGKFRWRLVIKCKTLEKLIDSFREVSDSFYAVTPVKPVELSVDINPANML